VAEKPHDAVEKFDTYQNLQQHSVVLPLKYKKKYFNYWYFNYYTTITAIPLIQGPVPKPLLL